VADFLDDHDKLDDFTLLANDPTLYGFLRTDFSGFFFNAELHTVVSGSQPTFPSQIAAQMLDAAHNGPLDQNASTIARRAWQRGEAIR
jgi:hypothetical protein